MANTQYNETENIDMAAYLTFKGFVLEGVKKSAKTPYRKVFVFKVDNNEEKLKETQIGYLNSEFRRFADNIAHFKNLIHFK